jgi:hypothetical protein
MPRRDTSPEDELGSASRIAWYDRLSVHVQRGHVRNPVPDVAVRAVSVGGPDLRK